MSWDRFWHAPAPTAALALFRAAFAACLAREVGTTLVRSRFAIDGPGFHDPYAAWIPRMDDETYFWVHLLQYPLILALGLGWAHRAAAAGLIGLSGWVFFADRLNFRNHPYFFLLVLGLLVFAPASETLSPRAALRAWRARRAGAGDAVRAFLGAERPRTAQRLLQVQVSLVYVVAGLHKLNPAYLDGDVLARILARSDLAGLAAWAAVPVRAAPLAWATVALELALPLGLWSRRLRPWAIAAGVLFHLGIAVAMNVVTFSAATVATYLLFVDPRGVAARVERALRAAGALSRRRRTPRG